MAKEQEPDSPTGAFPVRGARKPRPGEMVAARVAKLLKPAPAVRPIEADDERVKGEKSSGPKAVQPLNAGFFALEQIRQDTVSQKKRAKQRRKARGR